MTRHSLANWFPALAFSIAAGAVFLLTAATAPLPPSITTEQLTARMSAAIEGLKTLRCVVKAQERIGGNINQARSVMKLTYKPLRIYIKNQKRRRCLGIPGQLSLRDTQP
jgi:hypothetical protein